MGGGTEAGQGRGEEVKGTQTGEASGANYCRQSWMIQARWQTDVKVSPRRRKVVTAGGLVAFSNPHTWLMVLPLSRSRFFPPFRSRIGKVKLLIRLVSSGSSIDR